MIWKKFIKDIIQLKTENQINKYRIYLLALIFIISIITSFIIAQHIYLPFKNPWDIMGLLPAIKYNPFNNIIRFILLVVFPSFLLFLVGISRKAKNIFFSNNLQTLCKKPLNDIKTKTTSNYRYLFFAGSLIVCIIVGICIPTYYSEGKFDTFHEGESLGTSISWISGKLPYKDYIFVHGIFQDPLRAVVAYKLFGKSIGSVRTLESIIKICTILLFFVFVLKIFNGNYGYAYLLFLLFLFLILSKPPFIIFMPRDVTTFAFLYVTSSLYFDLVAAINISKLKNAVNIILFSFLPIASFCYSIDRGFYILATYCILCPIIFYSCFQKKLTFYFCVCVGLGLLFGTLFMGVLLRWEFRAFFDFVFLTFPKYKELMDGMVYPLTLSRPYLMLPIFLISLALYCMTYRYMQFLHKSDTIFNNTWNYLQTHFMEICLLMMSIFYFRNALGRAEDTHVRYSSAIIVILWTYILLQHFGHLFTLRIPNSRKYITALIIVVVAIVVVRSLFEITDKKLLIENFPLKISDSSFISSNYASTISFLKENLNDDESFFTMTSEASWYYFIDKCCPTRFPVVWFAMPPFYQREIVSDLQQGNVKFILYRNEYWSNTIDGFASIERLPIVDAYIRSNYKYFKTIYDNELWVKNNFYISNIPETKL